MPDVSTATRSEGPGALTPGLSRGGSGRTNPDTDESDQRDSILTFTNLPDPVAVTVLLFVNDTGSQRSTSNNLAAQLPITTQNSDEFGRFLWQMASSLENVDNRPNLFGIPSRIPGSPVTWTIANPDPALENDHYKHHYFTMYKKTSNNYASNSQRIYVFACRQQGPSMSP